MAALDTVVNTFGGEWFNMNWQPQLTSPAFEAATNFYVNLVRKYGEPGASNDSFNQLLTLYGQGKCAMWYDATVAATSIATTYPSVSANTGYAFAPVDKTTSSGWLWTLVAGHPAGHRQLRRRLEVRVLGHLEALRLAGRLASTAGPRSRRAARTSLYNNPTTRRRPRRSRSITLASIDSTDPDHPTVNPVPYVGVQYVDIPQFESLGVEVGQQIAGAIAGTESVSQALQTSQSDASQYTPAELSGG